jgi:RNA polymerase sigma-70 factor (ECF subfamily)
VDQGSFEELALPLFDSLYNFACWLTHSRDEAEDLVQETYAKALRGFGSYQQGTNFRAWMYRILHNAFLNSRAGLQLARSVSLDEEGAAAAMPVETETPESLLLGRADEELIRAALEELPVIFREILLLCEVEEMSYQEAADALSIPMGTVMSRLARARRALREAARKRMPGK